MEQALGAEIVGVGVAGALAGEHANAAAGAGSLAGGFDDLLVDAQRGGGDRFEVEVGVVAAGGQSLAQAALQQALGDAEFLKEITLVTGVGGGTGEATEEAILSPVYAPGRDARFCDSAAARESIRMFVPETSWPSPGLARDSRALHLCIFHLCGLVEGRTPRQPKPPPHLQGASMYNAKAYAASSPTSGFASASIPRRDPGATDVQIEILFCGICHSDLHQARDEWHEMMPTVYPCVPGHEIVGRVTKVGSGVKKFKVGDLAAVGCMVDSDRTCPECKAGLEQFCNNLDPHLQLPRQRHRRGDLRRLLGFASWWTSTLFCTSRRIWIPPEPRRCSAPGITTYSPMRHWGVAKGKKVGVAGLGGLGHMAVKFSHALGAHTVVFTTSPSKADDAQRLGADEVVYLKRRQRNAEACRQLRLHPRCDCRAA